MNHIITKLINTHEQKLRKKISDSVEDKMNYLACCPNEKEIYLHIIDPNYPRLKTLHCNTDCHISDCKLYHSGENDKDKAMAIKTLAESPVPISDNAWWTGYCPRCGQLLQYHFHSPNDDGDHKQYCFKCGQLVDFGK